MSDSTILHSSVRFKSDNFNKKIQRYLENNKKHRRTAKEIFFRLLFKVIDKTPVATGRARSGWGAGAEAGGMPATYDTLDKREGRSKSRFSESTGGARVRMVCVNGVEYIEALEHGHSGQAPFGMVRVSIAELEDELELGGGLPELIRAVYQEAWDRSGSEAGTEFRAGELRQILPDLFAKVNGS